MLGVCVRLPNSLKWIVMMTHLLEWFTLRPMQRWHVITENLIHNYYVIAMYIAKKAGDTLPPESERVERVHKNGGRSVW